MNDEKKLKLKQSINRGQRNLNALKFMVSSRYNLAGKELGEAYTTLKKMQEGINRYENINMKPITTDKVENLENLEKELKNLKQYEKGFVDKSLELILTCKTQILQTTKLLEQLQAIEEEIYPPIIPTKNVSCKPLSDADKFFPEN